MKVDIDTIVYILISIVILVFSGIRGARKRKAQRMQTQGNPPPAQAVNPEAGYVEETEIMGRRETEPPPPLPGLTSIQRLEKLLSGELGFEPSPEPYTEPVADEDEIIYEEGKESDKEPVKSIVASRFKVDDPDDLKDEDLIKPVKGLFRDVDEIKRAIIYNEIFNRKYI